MSDVRDKLLEDIKVQGEFIRKLKAEKAPKDQVLHRNVNSIVVRAIIRSDYVSVYALCEFPINFRNDSW